MKKKPTTRLKKPVLVLNDVNKFYLATTEITNSESDLYIILSLFLPVKNGRRVYQLYTEAVAYDDAESAARNLEVLSRYCGYNVTSEDAEPFQQQIKDFYNRTEKMLDQGNENVR